MGLESEAEFDSCRGGESDVLVLKDSVTGVIRVRAPFGARALHLSRPNSVFTLRHTLLCVWFSSNACSFVVFATIYPLNRRWRCKACQRGIFLNLLYFILGGGLRVVGSEILKAVSSENFFLENTQTCDCTKCDTSQFEHIEAVFVGYFLKYLQIAVILEKIPRLDLHPKHKYRVHHGSECQKRPECHASVDGCFRLKQFCKTAV